MDFFVKKMIWEYGETYNHVYYPKSINDLQEKVLELDAWGRANNYPFLIEMACADGNHISFTVGHFYSLFEFNYTHHGKASGPIYMINPEGRDDEIIPIYYMASYSEPNTTRMLPQGLVLQAIYYYIEHQRFPAFIKLDDEQATYLYANSDE